MIPLFKPFMCQEAIDAAIGVLKSGKLTQGERVEEFESNLATHFQSPPRHIITTNSATSAMHLVLHSLKQSHQNWPGLSEGDDCITTSLTCVATNWPSIHAKLNLIFADIDANSFNIDIDDIVLKLTPKTKIIILVHWGGNPVDHSLLNEALKNHEQKFGYRPQIIQDCAHAMGSLLHNKPMGSNNRCINIFSLQAIKHVTSVDGGFIIWNNDYYSKQCRLLRWYGIDRNEKERYDFRAELPIGEQVGPGFKYHMNDLSAAIGNANFKKLSTIINHYQRISNIYNKTINNPRLLPQVITKNSQSSYWLYTLKAEDGLQFSRYMDKHNIITSKVHERNDIHPFARKFITQPLQILDKLNSQLVCIPIHAHITDIEAVFISKIANDWVDK